MMMRRFLYWIALKRCLPEHRDLLIRMRDHGEYEYDLAVARGEYPRRSE